MGRQQQRRCSSNTATDTVKQVVLCCIIRALKSELESHHVSRAVAFEDQTTQTQQGRAVVATMIHTLHQCR